MQRALLVVNPDTGELLEHLDQQPPEILAEALDAVRGRQAKLKQWGDALDGELRRRLKIAGRTLEVFGEWEVECKPSRTREWDPGELEGVLQQLVDDGTIEAAEATGVIVREPKVSGKAALALRGRLGEDGRALVDGAFTWKERPTPVVVARSVQLLSEAGDAQQHEQQHQEQDHVDEQIQRVSPHTQSLPAAEPSNLEAGATTRSPTGGRASTDDDAGKSRPWPGAAPAPQPDQGAPPATLSLDPAELFS
jgi:hypothetical protein